MARTRFGRWLRDRFRRTLGIADVAERTSAVQTSLAELTAEASRSNARHSELASSLADLAEKIAAIHSHSEAQQSALNSFLDRSAPASSEPAFEKIERTQQLVLVEGEQVKVCLREEANRIRAAVSNEVEQARLRTTEEADRTRGEIGNGSERVRLYLREESDHTRGVVATESVAIRQEVIVRSEGIQRRLAELIESIRGLNGQRSPEVLRLEAELREWQAKPDPRTAGFLNADDEDRLIVLEYPPSYDFRARWGYTRPSHAGLIELFATEHPRYAESLRKMVERLPNFERINREFSHDLKGVAGWIGGPQNTIDSAMLYHYVAEYKPKTYLEIGSGLSTLFAYRAVKDYGLNTRIVSIDPNPRALVDGVCDEVIREAFEMSDLKAFESLEPGDIVYMDGSHRTFPNSDVTVFMLDVLPKLKPGIIVHIHDILLPDDYPQEFCEWYWSEQYILAAYLLGMGDKIEYLMPVYYATQRLPGYREILRPVLDWWGKDKEDSWLAGGSIWFTHRGPVAPGDFH